MLVQISAQRRRPRALGKLANEEFLAVNAPRVEYSRFVYGAKI